MKDVLGYELTLLLDNTHRVQEVMKGIRHHSHLVLDNFEVRGNYIPNISAAVLLGIFEVPADALAQDRRKLGRELFV